MKIIITGGTGYIGSHTSVAFLEAGFDVVIIDNLDNSNIKVLNGIYEITGKKPKFYNMDCKNINLLENVFKEHNDALGVIHFAALKAVGDSVLKPLEYYRNNILSLINVLDLMKKYKITNFVFSSSATVYGEADILPVTELSPVKEATSPYGNTKIIAEQIIKDCVKSYNIKTVILRYFNPIGAHPSALIGELPIGVPNNLIPYITQTVAGIRKELKVFGNDYDTEDGFAVRDYIDINDLADAHVISINYLNKNDIGTYIFNLGTGRGLSVMEIINTFEDAVGKKINYSITERRQGDVPAVWSNCNKANKELCWYPKRTIADSLISAWKWQEKLMLNDYLLES